MVKYGLLVNFSKNLEKVSNVCWEKDSLFFKVNVKKIKETVNFLLLQYYLENILS